MEKKAIKREIWERLSLKEMMLVLQCHSESAHSLCPLTKYTMEECDALRRSISEFMDTFVSWSRDTPMTRFAEGRSYVIMDSNTRVYPCARPVYAENELLGFLTAESDEWIPREKVIGWRHSNVDLATKYPIMAEVEDE